MKKLLIIAAAMLFILPVIAMAQDLTPRNTYVATADPEGTALDEAPWAGPYAAGEPIGQQVAPGETVWIGVENLHELVNLKALNVIVTGGAGLEVSAVLGYTAGGAYGASAYDFVDAAGNLEIDAQIFPQPDWEVIVLTNNTAGAIVIASIEAVSDCEFIPTMTHYGLGILALLLIASTVWILRRRKASAVA